MFKSKYQAFTDTTSENVFQAKKQANPIMLVVFGYLMLITVGAVLLRLPVSTREPIDFLQALFTATSAVCVTGLSVLDISSTFTNFGDWVLVILMQSGGLGIMTVSTVLILLAGMHPGFNHQSVLLSDFTQEGNVDAGKILKAVIPFTFILEAIGGVVYFTQFHDMPLYDRIFASLFQAVSSFCNVGFTLFPDSLVQFQLNPVMNIVTCILVLAGGFGFLAITELQYAFDFRRKRFRKVSLHTRIATFGTMIVVAVSILVFTLTEWGNSLAGLDFFDKMQSTFFMAFTSRTAGLNTVDVPGLCASSLFFFIVIMFVGANPGSCGGGIKITTAAVISLLGFNRLLGREKTQVMGRTIPETTVDKAVRIFVVAIVVITLATLILLYTEIPAGIGFNENGTPFLKILFEVVSAYSTCGLSMGLTGELSTVGQLVICCVMFIGRMGPLFLISAVAGMSKNTTWFAEEDIMVG
ncbi:TrkH family potassium uptake protein [Fibrobacter sp.]|uniref:TrkH family potassium uptake protein n=1 Tax=Fibrobacter sp. TaxID=35828 RepID=UPI00388F69E3